MSSLIPNEIDIVDQEILLLITRGNPSPYSIWSTMNKLLQGKGMAYINIKKRIRHLVEKGLLEGIKPDTTIATMRGRKDYKVTMLGMVQLIPYILSHSKNIPAKDEVPAMIEYMDKSDLDKQGFGFSLVHDYFFATVFVNEYLKHLDKLHEIVSTDYGDMLHEVIPTGLGRIMHELVEKVDEAEAETEALIKAKSKAKGRKTTVIRVSDDTQVTDSAATKAAHALRVSSSNPTRKKH